MRSSRKVGGAFFHTRVPMPRISTSATSSGEPGWVSSACACAIDIAGHGLWDRLSDMGITLSAAEHGPQPPKRSGSLVLVLGYSGRSYNRKVAMIKPEAVGLSGERLERLDRRMTEKYVETGLLPGFVVQVFRQGALAHTGIAGQLDMDRGKAMQEDTIFRIYSMTKPITAVALMMLVEEGRIALDD